MDGICALLLPNLFSSNLRCSDATPILSRFAHFLCGEKLGPKFCPWRKNDKYNVWTCSWCHPRKTMITQLKVVFSMYLSCTQSTKCKTITYVCFTYHNFYWSMDLFEKLLFCEIVCVSVFRKVFRQHRWGPSYLWNCICFFYFALEHI